MFTGKYYIPRLSLNKTSNVIVWFLVTCPWSNSNVPSSLFDHMIACLFTEFGQLIIMPRLCSCWSIHHFFPIQCLVNKYIISVFKDKFLHVFPRNTTHIVQSHLPHWLHLGLMEIFQWTCLWRGNHINWFLWWRVLGLSEEGHICRSPICQRIWIQCGDGK